MSSVAALPALLVVLPLLAAVAPLLLGLRRERVGWSVAAVTATVAVALALRLATAVFTEGRVVHQLGGYPRPIGIELVADQLSTLLVLLITLTAAAVLVVARRLGPRGNTFYSAYLLVVGGLLGVSLTGDLFNMFVFLEISSLATYTLVASGRSAESAVAALKYLVVGTVGASLFLIGVGLAFVATGTLNMIDLSSSLAAVGYDSPLVLASFAFVFVGFAVKSALFPLHTWQPDAYQHAPDSVTALISALASTVAAYALLRVTYTVYTVEFLRANPLVGDVVVTVAGVSVVAGSALAAIQSDVKRMFAYSSVSQFGLVALAVGLANETALLGGIVHLIGHGVMKGGLFVAIATIAAATGARTVDEYAGLGARTPFGAGALAVLGLALVGVPPTVGLVGKWYVALGAVESGAWPAAVVVLVSTLLTLAYVARLLETMYFDGASGPAPEAAVADGGDGAAGEAPADETAESERSDESRVPVGAVAVAVGAALAAVLLGFAGAEFAQLLEPLLEAFFNP